MRQIDKIRAVIDAMEIYEDNQEGMQDVLACLFEVLQDEIRLWKKEAIREGENKVE